MKFDIVWFFIGVGSSVSLTSANVEKSELNPNKFSSIHILRLLKIDADNYFIKNKTWSCSRSKTLHSLYKILSADSIEIWSGIRLVRLLDSTQLKNNTRSSRLAVSKDLKDQTLFSCLTIRLSEILSTHILQINFNELLDVWRNEDTHHVNLDNANANDQARFRRHHRSHMMMAIMFTVTAFGAILIPIGFQIISVVSGKALLLAKMALLLASINGLKKVANSGLHYGLYHVPGESGSYYDRRDPTMRQ